MSDVQPARQSFLTDRAFWLAAGERAVKTAAQSAVATLALDQVGLIGVDWIGGLSVVGAIMLASLLTSIGSGAVTDGTPSLSTETIQR